MIILCFNALLFKQINNVCKFIVPSVPPVSFYKTKLFCDAFYRKTGALPELNKKPPRFDPNNGPESKPRRFGGAVRGRESGGFGNWLRCDDTPAFVKQFSFASLPEGALFGWCRILELFVDFISGSPLHGDTIKILGFHLRLPPEVSRSSGCDNHSVC
jgi:hypothetical protein